MNASTATTLGPTTSPPGPVAAASGSAQRVEAQPIPLAGSGAFAVETPGVASATHAPAGDAVPLDAFAKRGGPDVAVKTDAGMVAVHAVFQVDPATNELQVSIVDDAGRLVRMIPPDSVSRMIAAMATYRGR